MLVAIGRTLLNNALLLTHRDASDPSKPSNSIQRRDGLVGRIAADSRTVIVVEDEGPFNVAITIEGSHVVSVHRCGVFEELHAYLMHRRTNGQIGALQVVVMRSFFLFIDSSSRTRVVIKVGEVNVAQFIGQIAFSLREQRAMRHIYPIFVLAGLCVRITPGCEGSIRARKPMRISIEGNPCFQAFDVLWWQELRAGHDVRGKG